jgi:hypothetical protein
MLKMMPCITGHIPKTNYDSLPVTEWCQRSYSVVCEQHNVAFPFFVFRATRLSKHATPNVNGTIWSLRAFAWHIITVSAIDWATSQRFLFKVSNIFALRSFRRRLPARWSSWICWRSRHSSPVQNWIFQSASMSLWNMHRRSLVMQWMVIALKVRVVWTDSGSLATSWATMDSPSVGGRWTVGNDWTLEAKSKHPSANGYTETKCGSILTIRDC